MNIQTPLFPPLPKPDYSKSDMPLTGYIVRTRHQCDFLSENNKALKHYEMLTEANWLNWDLEVVYRDRPRIEHFLNLITHYKTGNHGNTKQHCTPYFNGRY